MQWEGRESWAVVPSSAAGAAAAPALDENVLKVTAALVRDYLVGGGKSRARREEEVRCIRLC